MLADGNGLYLRIGPSGSRSWVYRYMAHGKRHDMGLGSASLLDLGEARKRAQEQRRLLRLEGRDPLTTRRHGKAMTFRQATEGYCDAHRDGWHPRHALVWLQSVRDYAWSVFGDLPVQAVDTGLVVRALRPIWSERTETAKRVRGRIESVLDYAASLGYRQGENPARWKGHLEYQFAKPSRVRQVEHFAALPYAELPAFMAKLRQENSIAAPALEFAILTAARAGEVLGATWGEIDLAERTWTIPAARMKARRDHRVPLSDAALAILEQMAEMRHSDFLFPGQRGQMGPTAMHDTLRRRMKFRLTVHGFRSTFASWAAEQTAYPYEVREMALAHNVGSAVERAYQRSDLFDRRRGLMEDWATFCAPLGDI
jgi:integrase